MTRCERVYNIFKTLSNTDNRLTLIDGWRKVFNTNEIFDIYFYLERLYFEIELLEAEFQNVIPDKIYKPILKRAKEIIKNYNFNNHLSYIKMSEKELAQFYGFSFIGIDEDVVEFDYNDDLKVMLNSLNELKNNELKLTLTDIISTLHRIETLPKINGKIGLEESFKELYCKLNVNIEDIQKAPKTYKEKLINIYLLIDKSINFTEKWLKRSQDFIKLIEYLGG